MDDETVPEGERLYALAENVKRMLEADEQSERLAAVQEVLGQRPNCGFAYAVLAREAARTDEEAEQYYRQAVSCLKDEYPIERIFRQESEAEVPDEDLPELEPYLVKPGAYVIVAAELARLIWRSGRQDEALSAVLALLDEHKDDAEELMFLAASWLIQLGRDAEARALIDRDPSCLPEWYYTNALLIYRSQGDTAASRAALYDGLAESSLIAELISDPDAITDDGYDDIELEDEERFADDARCAWHRSPGSLEWMLKVVRSMNLAAADGTHADAASEKAAEARLKRWRDDFESALAFLERGDHKSAKRLLRSALREAEKLGPASEPFRETVDTLIELLNESGGSSDEMEALLDRQLATAEALHAGDKRRLALSCASIARRFMDMEKYDKGEAAFARACNLLEQLLQANDSFVTLRELSSSVFGRAFCLGSQKRYAEAVPLFRLSIELQEQFLGANHFDHIPNLDYLRRSLHHLGEHSEEASVWLRLSAIAGDELDDPHRGHGAGCSWSVSGCPSC
ncbi:MAG TPA: hypothetical protein V6D08_19340 [Candidatus Obscuribacterales bacterium]